MSVIPSDQGIKSNPLLVRIFNDWSHAAELALVRGARHFQVGSQTEIGQASMGAENFLEEVRHTGQCCIVEMLVGHQQNDDNTRMIARSFALYALMVASFVLLPINSVVGGSKPPTAPGQYRDWNDDIDEVTILRPFDLNSYNDIAVESFDVTRVPLPDPNDNTHAAVRSALSSVKPAFLEGFQKNLRQKPGSHVHQGKGQTLVVLVRLTKLDPGSQAARYWASFGAGAVKIEVAGDIVDARSRTVLIRFKQERRSGFGVFGGGYGELFRRTARQIGGDVADLLNAF